MLFDKMDDEKISESHGFDEKFMNSLVSKLKNLIDKVKMATTESGIKKIADEIASLTGSISFHDLPSWLISEIIKLEVELHERLRNLNQVSILELDYERSRIMEKLKIRLDTPYEKLCYDIELFSKKLNKDIEAIKKLNNSTGEITLKHIVDLHLDSNDLTSENISKCFEYGNLIQNELNNLNIEIEKLNKKKEEYSSKSSESKKNQAEILKISEKRKEKAKECVDSKKRIEMLGEKINKRLEHIVELEKQTKKRGAEGVNEKVKIIKERLEDQKKFFEERSDDFLKNAVSVLSKNDIIEKKEVSNDKISNFTKNKLIKFDIRKNNFENAIGRKNLKNFSRKGKNGGSIGL